MVQPLNSSKASKHSGNRVSIYGKAEIDQLCWPETADAKRAKSFLLPLIENGVKHYIENIDTQIYALSIDDLVLPVTVNSTEYDNSYVCSAYGQYIVCSLKFLKEIDNPAIRIPLSMLMKGLGVVFKGGKINQVVCVNNWLVSTNLYPKISQEQISAILTAVKQRFPNYSILLRSIQSYDGNTLANALTSNGFKLVPSRKVYILDTKVEEKFTSRIFKSDFKALKESSYVSHAVMQTDDQMVDRLCTLYKTIYLDKHSTQNPAFTREYIKLILGNGLLELTSLEKDGSVDAVAGYFCCNGMMTSPFLGYDTDISKSDKLYRLICTLLVMHAREKKFLFHLSSGASFFKKIRKADTAMEYMAVYHRHLPWHRKLPWQILSGLLNTIGKKMMDRYEP